jgi:hypothetical protein
VVGVQEMSSGLRRGHEKRGGSAPVEWRAVGRRWSGGDRVGGGEGEVGSVCAAAGDGEVGFGDGSWAFLYGGVVG